MSYPAELAAGLAGGEGLRRADRVRAPPSPLRVQPPLPQPAWRTPGSRCSGTSPDDRLVEFVELAGHPFWVGTQAHPEFKSRPDRPHPLFREFVGAALGRAEGRTPRLLDLDALRADCRETFRKLGERAWSTGRSLISVARATFAAPDGGQFERDVVHHPGAVSVVPVVDEGTAVLLVRQYRAAIDRELLEIPAGKRDVDGEPVERTARRELEEEVGMRAGTAGEAGRVLQLARLLRRALVRVHGARPRARATSSAQGVEEQHMTIERVSLDDVPGLIAERRAHRRQVDHRPVAGRVAPLLEPLAGIGRRTRSRRAPRADRGVPVVAGGRTRSLDEHIDRLPARPGRRMSSS